MEMQKEVRSYVNLFNSSIFHDDCEFSVRSNAFSEFSPLSANTDNLLSLLIFRTDILRVEYYNLIHDLCDSYDMNDYLEVVKNSKAL